MSVSVIGSLIKNHLSASPVQPKKGSLFSRNGGWDLLRLPEHFILWKYYNSGVKVESGIFALGKKKFIRRPAKSFARCMSPAARNGFRERKVYHNFVLILYNFVHQVQNFVHHSPLRYRQFKFGGMVTCSPPPKCSFNIKNWIIILYSFYTILYTESEILYTIPSCAIGNSNLGEAGDMQPPNAIST